MKMLYLYQSTNDQMANQALLKNFTEILPDLLNTLTNVEIATVKIAGDNFSSKEVNFFLDKAKAKFLLVDESLSRIPIKKVILKKGMNHKEVLKQFGFAAI